MDTDAVQSAQLENIMKVAAHSCSIHSLRPHGCVQGQPGRFVRSCCCWGNQGKHVAVKRHFYSNLSFSLLFWAILFLVVEGFVFFFF